METRSNDNMLSEILEGDGLPSLICNKCIARLNVAYQFKIQCENSDSKLREFFANPENLPQGAELLGFSLEMKDNQKNDLIYNDLQVTADLNNTNEMLEELDVKYGNINSVHENHKHDINHLNILTDLNESTMVAEIESSIVDETKFDNHRNILNSNHLSDEKKIVRKIKRTIVKKQNQNYIDENGQIVKKKSVKQKKIMIPKVHQCDTCGKIFRTKPGLIHHIRIHTGERPYLCHLCDKRFVNGGHLHTHMRTHTGEKKHICTACSKAFATAQQLTKHTIAIHTNERPYACTYCPKRFASSSNLSTHVKIHTGEKNYHCDQCGKAFSTKGQLYQHMLVHTGEKAFLCEYCNKRFSQKAHLIRHSKMHTK